MFDQISWEFNSMVYDASGGPPYGNDTTLFFNKEYHFSLKHYNYHRLLSYELRKKYAGN